MTRWLVTGARGQVGHHVVAALTSARVGTSEVAAFGRQELDITSADSVAQAVATVRPDVVVNLAAYTAVDAAETDEMAAALVNERGPELLASALTGTGARLIHVSTDYVFDGTPGAPHEPGDPVGPRTAYGRTKLAGERAVREVLPESSIVVRTAWVYGGPGANFVDTMLRLAAGLGPVDVVADQVGSPTWAADLAGALVELGQSGTEAGVVHYVNGGAASWFDLARATFELGGSDPARVRPVDATAFPRPARRPDWSVLSTASWTDRGLTAPRGWRAALADCVAGSRRI